MLQIFRDIDELVTCAGVAARDGRRVSEEHLGIIRDAAIVIKGGKIAWLGAESELPTKFAESTEEISCGGRCVMPAFVECHTHLVFAGDRTEEFELRNRGVSYQEIAKRGGGILSTVKQTRQASGEELLNLAEERMWRFIRQGVATIECKSGYGLDAKTEIKMLQVIRNLKPARMMATFLGAHAIAPEFQGQSSKYLQFLEQNVLPQIRDEKLADRIDIFIEDGYFPCDQAKSFLQTAQGQGLRIAIHAEQLSRTGASQLAVELNADSADHLVCISMEDIQSLAHSPVTCVLLPASDLYLHLSYPPARALLDQGARVALATDYNPGSSPTQDLSLIGLLARLEMKMTLAEVIAAYTFNAARALNRSHLSGSLEVGKLADFIELKDNWRSLFFQVGYHPIESVWIDGHKQICN